MVTINGNQDVPTFTNYAVTAATISGGTGVIQTPVDDGKKTETVEIRFDTIAKQAQVVLTLSQQGSLQYASATTCTVNNGGKTTVTGWYKPWEGS